MEQFRIALQLYSVRTETEKDFIGACRRVAEIGYEWVELAGFGGLLPCTLRTELTSIGLGVSGSHVSHDALIRPEEFIDTHLQLGCKDVIIAWLPEEFRNSVESWKATARKMNDAAKKFHDSGLRLGFHNHAVEFQVFEGKTGWEILFEYAPDVQAQVDVFWVAKTGHSPEETIRQLAGRVPSVHAKDIDESGNDVEFGRGVINWESVLESCRDAGVETLVAEMDTPRLAPFESARACLEGLRLAL